MLALLLLIAAPALADEVELTTGEIITDCKAVEEGDQVIVTRGPITRTIPRSEVRSIRRCDTLDEEYGKRAREVADGDLEGRLKLAKWCASHGLADRGAGEFRRVLVLDPDHEEARAALGFKRHLGQWLTEDQVREAQGLVKHKGRWMTPEQRDLEAALDAQKELDKQYTAEVSKWTRRLDTSKEADVKEAKEKLAGLADSYKVKPYLDALRCSREQVRRFAVEELTRMKDEIRKAGAPVLTEAAKSLARRAVWDTSEGIRASALDALQALDHDPSWSYLSPYLSDDSSTLRRRTEEALGRLGNPKSAPALVDVLAGIREELDFIAQYERQIAQIIKGALVLKNGQRVTLPPNLKIVTSSFDAESKKRLAEEKSEVLKALTSVTGQDFGDDVAKWKTWCAGTRGK